MNTTKTSQEIRIDEGGTHRQAKEVNMMEKESNVMENGLNLL